MLTKGISLSWPQKAPLYIILCNKDRLSINPNSPIGNLLENFESNPKSLSFSKNHQINRILEDISKKFELKYFDTAQYDSIVIKTLPAKNEEEQFFEQIKSKETPLILLKRYSKDQPYAYFENNNGSVYLLTAFYTQNSRVSLYCNFNNQWKSFGDNSNDDGDLIKFNKETVFIYTKINKGDLDKEKLDKHLPSEYEENNYGSKISSKGINNINGNYKQVKIIRTTFIIKDAIIAELKSPKIIEMKQESHNDEDTLKDDKNQIEHLKAEVNKLQNKIKNAQKIQKDHDCYLETLIKYYKNQLEGYENLKKEIEKLNGEMAAEKTKNTENALQLQNYIEIQGDLQQKIQKKDDIIKNYDCQLEDFKNKNNISQIKIEDLSKKLEKTINENKTLETINSILQEESGNHETQLETLRKEIEELRLKLKNSPNRIINYPLVFNGEKSGIPNIGNTCYLNSLLQILASNNEFCEKIQPLEYGLFSSLSSLLLSIRNPGSNNTNTLVRSFKNQLGSEFPWVIFI